jgi:hypothetical protein
VCGVGCVGRLRWLPSDLWPGRERDVLAELLGPGKELGMCLEKAGELCGPPGYRIISESGDSPGLLVTGSSAAPVISSTMLVKCGRE